MSVGKKGLGGRWEYMRASRHHLRLVIAALGWYSQACAPRCAHVMLEHPEEVSVDSCGLRSEVGLVQWNDFVSGGAYVISVELMLGCEDAHVM